MFEYLISKPVFWGFWPNQWFKLDRTGIKILSCSCYLDRINLMFRACTLDFSNRFISTLTAYGSSYLILR